MLGRKHVSTSAFNSRILLYTLPDHVHAASVSECTWASVLLHLDGFVSLVTSIPSGPILLSLFCFVYYINIYYYSMLQCTWYIIYYATVCWTIHAALGWNWLDHRGYFFDCVLRFGLPVFYWFCLHQWSLKGLVCSSLSVKWQSICQRSSEVTGDGVALGAE